MSTLGSEMPGQNAPPNRDSVSMKLKDLSVHRNSEQPSTGLAAPLESPFSRPHLLAQPQDRQRTLALRLDTTPEALNDNYTDYVSRKPPMAADTPSSIDSTPQASPTDTQTPVSLSMAPTSAPTSAPNSGSLNSALSPRSTRGSASGAQAADMQARIMALQRSRSRQSYPRSVSSSQPMGDLSRRSSSSSSIGSARRTSQNDGEEFGVQLLGKYKMGDGEEEEHLEVQAADPQAPAKIRSEPPSRNSSRVFSRGPGSLSNAFQPRSSQSAPLSSESAKDDVPLPSAPTSAPTTPFPSQPSQPATVPTASNGFDPNTVISPTAMSMAAGGMPISLNRASSFRTRQRSSLSARRGMKLDIPGDCRAGPGQQTNTSTSPSTPNRSNTSQTPRRGTPQSGLGAGEKGNRGLFRDYRKYIDIESGSLNFAGKACVHAQGIEFSSGEKFQISMDKLEFISEIGRGNYGTVQKLLHKPNNVLMAVKEIRLELDEANLRQIIMELDVLHRCSVESIIAFYGAFFVEGSVYICMEYMDGGSINMIYEGGVPERYLKYIVRAVVSGLKELKEDFNIIHRDVKPTNILCSTNGQVKLCDFGVSGNLVASIARTNIGCQAYMAPERIKPDPLMGNPAGRPYTVESDIWSLGLSIIEMAKGSYPYPPDSFQSILSQLNAIVDDPAPALDPGKYSPEACDFVNRLLSKSPTERPRYSDVVKHPWLATVECTREEMGEFVTQRLAMHN